MQSSPTFDSPAFWTALPSLLWFGLAAGLLVTFRKHLHDLLSQLVARVRAGAPMSFGAWEIGPVTAQQLHQPAPLVMGSECLAESAVSPGGHSIPPHAAALAAERTDYYTTTHRIIAVHRLFRSTRNGQDYDVLIYLVPHGDQSLIHVTGVEYFLGRYWGNEVFESYDRSRGFPITVAAWGSFLCTVRVAFNDGTSAVLHRNIDFEMGDYAPLVPQGPEQEK